MPAKNLILVAAMVLATTGCSKKTSDQPATTSPPKASEPGKAPAAPAAPTAPVQPAAAANPAVAELAPLWPEIAKCEDMSDLYAHDKCPANFTLLETAKAAYEAADKQPDRLSQVHDALVDQIINGTDLKARQAAAYADWSKASSGGKKFADDSTQALALLAALTKLGKDGDDIGYEIANILGDWWKKDGPVRKQMMATFADKEVKSLRGRRELIRHAAWVADEVPDIVAMMKTIAADVSDDVGVREEAIGGLGSVARAQPELADTLLPLTSDPNERIVSAAVSSLGSVKPATEYAKKAQARILELATIAGAPVSGFGDALGRVGDMEGLAAVAVYYKANATKPDVTSFMSDVLNRMAWDGRFKGDAAADAALRKGIAAVLKDKALTAWAKRSTMSALGTLGGPKSVALCKKYTKDAEANVAEAATKCVETSAAVK